MPDTMTVARCQGCGVKTDALGAAGHCLNCEHAYIAADLHAAEASLELIEAAVRAALDRAYVHPDDVLTRVGQAIREEQEDAWGNSLEDLHHANRRNMDARKRANGVEA